MPVSHVSIMTTKLAFLLIGLWWGSTALIDFIVVPTIFSVINDFFNAGELGMTLFKKLNFLELFFAISILVLEWRSRRKVLLLALFSVAAIVIFYFTYLTPKIGQLSSWWKEAEAQGLLGIHGISDIQQEHQFFHRFYVSLDACKFLILSAVLGFKIIEQKSTPKNA